MYLTTARIHAALNAIYSGSWTAPPPLWCGLSLTPVVETDTGYTNITEPTAPSYGRVQVDPSDWPAAVNRMVETVVQFPDPVEDLGVSQCWVLFDAATGGTATDAGEHTAAMDLQAGASDIRVTCQVTHPFAA